MRRMINIFSSDIVLSGIGQILTKSELFYTNRAGQKIIQAAFSGEAIFGNDCLKGIWFCFGTAFSVWIVESLLRTNLSEMT